MRLLAKEFYINALKEINGSQFTAREIDVIACIMHNKGEKKIASILGISPSTANTHTYNIMSKLGLHSRESIINFIESSNSLGHIRGYYFYLLLNSLFKKYLGKIGRLHNEKILCNIQHNELSKEHIQILRNLTECLNLVNINVVKDNYNSKDVHFNVNIIDKESNFNEIMGSNKINFIINRFNELPLKDSKNINVNDIKEFHNSVFKLIQKMLGNKYNLSVVFKDFENDYGVLKASTENGLTIKNNNKSIGSKESHYKPYLKYLLIIIGFVFAILTGWILHINGLQNLVYFAEYRPSKQIKSYTELDKIFSIIEEHKLLADNLTAEKLHKNYTVIKQFEQIDKNYSPIELKDYFSLPDNSQKLVIYLYSMQAAASYHNYQEHDRIKAMNILIKAKDLAATYINDMNRIPINFDDLSPKELLNELGVVKALPEIYTRILYTLGRSYMLQNNLQEASYCFRTAEYLGNKLKLFEGYLSKYKGLMELERLNIAIDIKKGKKQEAKSRLLALLDMYEQYKNDKKGYIINYYPYKKPQIISLKHNMQHMVECGTKSMQLYSMLLSITDDNQEKFSYSESILKQVIKTDSYQGIFSFIDKVNPRKKAESFNIIGNVLMQMYESKINLAPIKEALSRHLKFNNTEELDFIEQIFKLAMLEEKTSDYSIKIENFEGLIRVYEKKINSQKLTNKQKNDLIERVKELKLKKEHIKNLYK